MGRWKASCTSIWKVRDLHLSQGSSEVLTSTPHHHDDSVVKQTIKPDEFNLVWLVV